MEIEGQVINILPNKVIVRTNIRGKKTDLDIFLTPKRSHKLKEHVVVERSLVIFSIAIEVIPIKDENLCKLWLDYIIFPTKIITREKRKKDDERPGLGWAQDRLKN